MPIYEFVCETCGPFEQRRSVQQASEPMVCVTCQTVARRVYSLPNLSRTSSTEHKARLHNEQSADRPRVEQRARSEDATPSGRHPMTHHAPRRPWMVGH